MENDIYKDFVFRDGEWYISHETLMEKSAEYQLQIAKFLALTTSPDGPIIAGTPFYYIYPWYKVKNPEEFVKTLTKE